MQTARPRETRRAHNVTPATQASLRSDGVAAFVWMRWQVSSGLRGSFALDWVAGITGIRRVPAEDLYASEKTVGYLS